MISIKTPFIDDSDIWSFNLSLNKRNPEDIMFNKIFTEKETVY